MPCPFDLPVTTQASIPEEKLSDYRSETTRAAIKVNELRRDLATAANVVCRTYTHPEQMAFHALDDLLDLIIEVRCALSKLEAVLSALDDHFPNI